MSVDDTLCEMQKFCNSMVCESHSRKLKFIEAKYPTRSFYLMNRQELEEWFRCLSKENKAICSYCDEHDCYTCQRFFLCKRQIAQNCFFLLLEILNINQLPGKFMKFIY